VDDVPPRTDVGLTAIDVSVGAVTVSVAVTGVPFLVALIVAVVSEPTATVVTVKVAVETPAAIVTVAGTVTAALSDAMLIVTPPTGAGSFKVRVAVDDAPPTRDVGLSTRLPTNCVLTVKTAALVEAFNVAVIVEVTVLGTLAVVMVTVPLVAPAAIVAEAGPVTAVPVAVKGMVNPPAGAADEIVKVPVVERVPKTVVGLRVNAVRTGALTVRVS